jgi:ankyrin repeat protein
VIAAVVGGKTALHFAVENGHEKVVLLLCADGAEPNLADENGR